MPPLRLSDVRNQRRREALSTLEQLNTSDQLAGGTSGGFVDRRGRAQRLVGGITKEIRRAPSGRMRRLLREGQVRPGFFRIGSWAGRAASSNFHAGSVVHRALMHEFSCTQPRLRLSDVSSHFPLPAPLDGGACRCAAVHGPLRIKKDERPVLDMCVDAARRFVAHEGLRPVLSEQVVVDDKIGTRFDALMARYKPGTVTEEMVLVSWKTGGSAMYEVSKNSSAKQQREQTEHRNRNIMQVLYEACMLEREYGIRVDGAYVVNLMAANTGGVGYYMRLDRSDIEAAPVVYDEMRRLAK